MQRTLQDQTLGRHQREKHLGNVLIILSYSLTLTFHENRTHICSYTLAMIIVCMYNQSGVSILYVQGVGGRVNGFFEMSASPNDTHYPRLLLRDQDKSEHAEETKAHPHTL